MKGTLKTVGNVRQVALINLLRIGITVGFLGFWEYASGTLVRAFIISSPTQIFKTFVEYLTSGELTKHTWVTLEEIIIGYVIGCLGGIVIAFVLGRSKTMAAVFEPFILAFYGIPRIALAPLFIIWLGIGIWSKVGVVSLMVFFLTFFNVYDGLRHMDQDYVSLARLMGASEANIIRRITLPAISPYIMLGLRTSIPQAIIGAVVGEFIVSPAGLGYLIKRSAELMDTPTLFVGVFVLLVIVLLGNALLNRFEKLVIRWKQEEEVAPPA